MNSISHVVQSTPVRQSKQAHLPASVAAALQRLLTTTAKLWQITPRPMPAPHGPGLGLGT